VREEAVRESIAAARAAIDAIDRDLVELLNARARQAAAIGRAKHRLDEPVYQPEREETVFRQVLEANSGPLDDGAIRRLFERILDEARRLERSKTKT